MRWFMKLLAALVFVWCGSAFLTCETHRDQNAAELKRNWQKNAMCFTLQLPAAIKQFQWLDFLYIVRCTCVSTIHKEPPVEPILFRTFIYSSVIKYTQKLVQHNHIAIVWFVKPHYISKYSRVNRTNTHTNTYKYLHKAVFLLRFIIFYFA